MKKAAWIDLASLMSLIVTLVLFLAALFEKGFTHDLLLEAGVFLVSVKLVLATHKNQTMLKNLDDKVSELLARK